MDISIVKVGRRQFTKAEFEKAVKESTRYTEVCKALGMNETVQTTLDTLRAVIEELQLDTSHFKYKYNKSEGFNELAESRMKQYNLSITNKVYFDEFMNSFDKRTSMLQYKGDCGTFLESLGDRDFAAIFFDEIEDFAYGKDNCSEKTINNRLAHLRSMMIYIVKNNIRNASVKVNKAMLIWLLSK